MVSTDTETVPVERAPEMSGSEPSATPDPVAEPQAAESKETVAAEPKEAAEPKAAKKPRAAKAVSTAKKTRTVELTLTVTGTADGEWQAELTQAGKRVLQGLSVPAAAVSRAAAELHTDISTAIESVLETAREQHRARMAELEEELNKVKAALAELQEG
ncbi:hypothetical protein GCM10010171_58470 [Actinokineospora fastidiosa]|uniref:Mucin n=2 Tax=Pseudonocardiaceae TaxID=2070 RepID=A0A918GRG0_9PSEU|nr:hypothetical protein Actkin_02743 [Actinokineospora sp. UTMC 2448]GGS55836.1 hypothetical protein GCM10010171_58470 [Actinokineospora fastidiosa]